MDAAVAAALVFIHDKGMNVAVAARTAAQKLKLNASKIEPLRGRIRYHFSKTPPKKRACLLLSEAEEFLVNIIKAFSTLANPLSTGEVRCLAKVVGELDQVPSNGWMTSFRGRYGSRIELRAGKKSHTKTTLLSCYSTIHEWTKATGKILKGIASAPALVFNIDETRALPASRVKSLLADKRLKETHYQQAMDTTLYTLVSCVAADGTTLFCIYLFRYVPTKKGLRQSVYAPQMADIKHTRTDNSFPIYCAVTPKGYMNGQCWMETMKIFLELAGLRQGLGRQKQAVLFLDGCSSHLKDYTIEELQKNNITALYFPSNTSHILQPLDGECFAGYKPEAARQAQKAALGASLGAASEKHLSLLASVRAHEKAVSPEVVKASFKNRGIEPWNPAVALANATLATPTANLLAAHEEVTGLFFAEKVIKELKEQLTADTKTERKMIESMNSPTKMTALPNWKPRPRTPKRKNIPKIHSEETSSESSLSDSEDDELSGSSDESAEYIAPVRSPPRTAPSCSHCGRQRTHGVVELACQVCETYFLCLTCSFEPDALPEHLKLHPEEEGRRLRRRR